MDEKLKSTLDKIIRLTQQNAEFDKSLRDAMSLSYPVDNGVISDERINQIYEYCIEKILRKQAEEFYCFDTVYINNAVKDHQRVSRILSRIKNNPQIIRRII